MSDRALTIMPSSAKRLPGDLPWMRHNPDLGRRSLCGGVASPQRRARRPALHAPVAEHPLNRGLRPNSGALRELRRLGALRLQAVEVRTGALGVSSNA